MVAKSNRKCDDCGKKIDKYNISGLCRQCYNTADVPTPEEIAERAAEIRAENLKKLEQRDPKSNPGFPPEIYDPFEDDWDYGAEPE